MARIPTYRSQVGPEAGTRMDLPRVDANAFGAQVGTGLMRLGQALGARAEEQQRESRNQQRMAQLTRWVELRAETAKDRQDARANVAPDAADHQKKVLERFDARASAFMGGISDPELQAEYQARIAEARADLDLDEGAYVVGVRADKAARDADTAISTAANELYNIGTERGLQQQLTLFDQTFAAIPELNVEQRAKLTGYARNRLTRSYIEGLAERDPYAARDVLRSGKLNAFIDADNMTAIGNRVDAEIRGREAAQKAAAAAARQEARAAATLQLAAAREQRDQEIEWADGIVAVAEKNVPIPMQVMKQAAAVYARHGNPGKAISAEVIGTRNAVNLQFGNKNPVLLQREEQRLSAEIAQAGAKADPALIAARDQLRILRKTQRENAATDLLGWEARYGATIPDLDGSNPESFAERGRIARDAARRYGVPPQVLTSTEADAYAERLTNGTAQQKLQMARELSLFGAMASAAAKQVAARDPVAGWAVGLAGQGRFAAAQDLFAGADVVKGNPKIAPTANVDARFADTVGGAFRYMPPAALNTLKAAATNIYAARWGREGGSEWRPEAFDAGVRMALGGVKGSDGIERGGLGEWRGSPVALPAGVSQADFERSMALLSTEKLKASGTLRPVGDRGQDIPAETVRRGELLPVGDGLYYVQLPGASAPLNAANGKPFVLRIGRPER